MLGAVVPSQQPSSARGGNTSKSVILSLLGAKVLPGKEDFLQQLQAPDAFPLYVQVLQFGTPTGV